MSGLTDELIHVELTQPPPLVRRIPVSRTSFALSDRTAFDQAVKLAVLWIKRTSQSALPDAAARGEGFEFGNSMSIASVSALRVDNEDGRVWAAKVIYRGDTAARRDWITDLFVEQRLGVFARFGAQLTCDCSDRDPGFEHSRPRVVNDILRKLAGEADGESLDNTVQSVSIADLGNFTNLLYNHERRLPIVLISVDDAGGSQIDLDKLAIRLSGTAHLRSIAIEESFELSRLIGRPMSTYNGAVRVYMPGLEQESEDPFQHPLWLPPASGHNPRLINSIAARVLPLGFRDADGDARFWRVGLIRQAMSRKAADATTGTREQQLAAEIEALRFEREELKESAAAAESLMYEAAEKLNEAQADSAKLADENFKLRERLRSWNTSSVKSDVSLDAQDIRSVFDQDPTLETTLRVIGTAFTDRVCILDTALESARDSFSFLHRKKAFGLLWSLCTEYWSALSDGKGDAVARQFLGNSYAAKEAESISAAGLKRRTFSYDGMDLLMEKHIKIGTADNKSETLRIHFEWIADSKMIVIGYCGAHLDF